MFKKLRFLTLLLCLLAGFNAKAQTTQYSITQGGNTYNYTFNHWDDLLIQVETFTGTAESPVVVNISGITFDAAEYSHLPTAGHQKTLVSYYENIPYTTFTFYSCQFDAYTTLVSASFTHTKGQGTKFVFNDCTFDERLYGVDGGSGGYYYNIDVTFNECTFKSTATGGCQFGDLAFNGCVFQGLVTWDQTEAIVNATCGNPGTGNCDLPYCNSVGDPSTLTIKDCTFADAITNASWLRFIYGCKFYSYIIDLEDSGLEFYPCFANNYSIDLTRYQSGNYTSGTAVSSTTVNNPQTSAQFIFLAFTPTHIIYNGNAPAGATVTGSTVDNADYQAGGSFTAKANGFTCIGYSFTGWNTKADDTGTALQPGNVGTVNWDPANNVLYAQWEETGPFRVVRSGVAIKDYPTLQQAVDAAQSGDEIRVRPCSDFGVEEYGASYATYITDYISANGAEVYVENKSLTFKSMNGKDTAPLRDFAIVLVGNSTNKYNYTFDDLKFLGASIIILDNFEQQANFGTITVNECYAETCTLTQNRKLLKYTSHDLGNTGSSSAFLQWVQRPGIVGGFYNIGTTDALIFTDNTVKGTLLTTGDVKYTYFINGGSAPGTATITGNTFGDYDHNKSTFGIVFQTSQDNANIYVSGNTAYLANKSSHFVWMGMYLPNPIQGISVNVNNNEIFTGSYMANPPTRPYSTTGTPSLNVVYVSNNLSGVAKTYRNYVNGYCYNHINLAVTGGASFTADEQHGHTHDGHIKEVPQSYGEQKAVDIYLHNEADAFDGESHHDFPMGMTHYCDRCDEFEVAWPGYVTGRTDVPDETAVTIADYEVSGNNVLIKTANGFAWLVNVVNGEHGNEATSFSGKTVTLVNDIDMTAYIWMPIGTPETPFQGTFDGNGKIIKGVWNSETFGEPGLFGYVSGNGVIKNTFVQISGTKHPLANTSGGYYGIVANTIAGSAIVHSSEVMGTIEATNANAHIGGVVGKAEGSSEVHSVISYATLNGYDMGGIVNTLNGENAKLSNSYAKVTFTEKGRETGKDLAYSGTNIDNCYYVQGTTQKMSDGTTFTIPTAYNYGVSGCTVGTDRMVDKLNAWINDPEINGSDKYAAWSQPTTTDINGDCPVLKLKDFNTMARRSGQAQYLFYDADLDSQLTNANNTVYLFYGAQEGVETDYSGSHLYIDQDAALKTTGAVNANVGVVSGKTYGWHMFSTPLTEVPLGINYSGYEPAGNVYGTPSKVTFTASDGYFPTDIDADKYYNWDFYSFNEENSTWINYKRNTDDHYDTYTEGPIDFTNETNLVPGRGYLMALQDMTYMQGYGTLNNANVNATVTCSGHHVTGCNFIGNPYHAYLDFEEFYTANSSNLASASYSVIADGSYASYAAGGSKNPSQASRYIHPHQGFIVKVNAAGSLTFAPKQAVVDQTSPYREAHVDYPLVNLFATDSEGNREIATAELGRPENGGALKIEGMQMGKCTMSISNQGERYGIAFVEGNPEEVAVHFQATEDGDFTMKWNTYNGTFSYLHLIDNLTGMDIDCLSQSEYKFTASTGDYASRFKLKFEFTGIEESQEASESSSSFAFFHQGSLVVNGQGNLELIDLNGRVLMTKNLGEGQSTVALPEVPKGLYLLRLADDSNVKTQKIIIK